MEEDEEQIKDVREEIYKIKKMIKSKFEEISHE